MTKTKSGRKLFHPLATHFLVVVAFLSGSFFQPISLAATQSSQPTTVILVRHAEKKIVPPENKDPDISPEGEARAKEIARMFSSAGIAAIYATPVSYTHLRAHET